MAEAAVAQVDRRVLIIDDELGLREACRRALERFGYTVETAGTGQDGLTRALGGRFGVILLDVRMPDIDGIELLRHVRTHDPTAVCVIMTAYATVDMAVEAMKSGAYDFIEKPFSDDALLSAVERGFDRWQMQQGTGGLPSGATSAELSAGKASCEELAQFWGDSMRKVAHELRAPTAAIRSFLTLILQGYTTPEKAKEWQQRAADRADELLRLIDDLLNLARLKDPRFGSTPEPVSVEAVLKETVQLYAAEAEAKGVRFRVEARPCGTIVADPMHIKQLWSNLISNAVKYTSRGGQVTVRLFAEAGKVVGEVKDTGIGIAEEDQPRLFREFFRTEQAKAFAQHGTGLGLAIVQQIVQQYGGEIAVDSRLGRGTQFTFRLPAKAKST